MPKEKIEGQTTYQVTVGWQRDRDVQLGVGVVEGRSLLWQFLGTDDDMLAALGAKLDTLFPQFPQPVEELVDDAALRHGLIVRARALLDMLDVLCSDPTTSGYEWVWATLDRGQVNRTIRALRRARDQAYGADA